MLVSRRDAVGNYAATWGERTWFFMQSMRLPARGAANGVLAAGSVAVGALTVLCGLYAAYAIKCAMHIDMFPNAHLSDLIPG